MRVSKWGNSLAIRIPKPVIEGLNLKSGDDVDVKFSGLNELVVSKQTSRMKAIERMKLRAFALPDDYHFDRDEANQRDD